MPLPQEHLKMKNIPPTLSLSLYLHADRAVLGLPTPKKHADVFACSNDKINKKYKKDINNDSENDSNSHSNKNKKRHNNAHSTQTNNEDNQNDNIHTSINPSIYLSVYVSISICIICVCNTYIRLHIMYTSIYACTCMFVCTYMYI